MHIIPVLKSTIFFLLIPEQVLDNNGYCKVKPLVPVLTENE